VYLQLNPLSISVLNNLNNKLDILNRVILNKLQLNPWQIDV